jgi:carbamoyltransferase
MGIRYGHDASVALVMDGQIIANVAEERFTRIKNDGSFPINAIDYCLKEAGLEASELDAIVFPSKGYIPPPLFAFFDVSEESVPANRRGAVPILPIYFKPWKLSKTCKILTVEHHLAHAASAYYTSGIKPTERALVITLDGRGDDISVSVWRGELLAVFTPMGWKCLPGMVLCQRHRRIGMEAR